MIDNTAELVAELRLHAREEERLKAVYDMIHAARWQWKTTPDGIVDASWNDKLNEMVGYSADEINMSLDKWLSLIVPEDRERVLEETRKFNHDPSPDAAYDIEYRMLHKGGNRIWIHALARKLADEHGAYTEVIGTFIDITDQKEKEQQRVVIGALSEEYSSVYSVDLLTDELVIYKQSGRIQSLFGKTFHKLSYMKAVDAYIADGVADSDKEEMRNIMSTAYLKQQLETINVFSKVFINSSNQFCEMKVVRSEADMIVIGFAERDASIRHDLEQKEQLRHALDMAQAANRAKTTFLNNMSHDIRTPMNAIIGFTGLAASHIDNKELVENYLTKIGQSSSHLLSLINDVLDMSRIESGKMNINETPENLSAIIHSLRDIVQSEVHAKQLDFFIDTVDVLDECVICDKLRVNQVLLNILSNAIKYTPVGGTVSLRITEQRVSDNGYATYIFRIKDNGIGMSQEFLRTIYDPFTRVSSSTISGIQGTGLGMAITKNIVDMMGGVITVDSKENHGTTVEIEFSFKLAEAHREPVRIKELEGMRSLVVDDDAATCISTSKMLRNIGLRPEWCTSGKEAIIRTEEAVHQIGEHFKLYIIDWLMPDMNGIETTRRIRKVVGKEAPIIILTAYDWSDIEEEAREAGVTGFIDKPLFESDLQRELAKICGIMPTEPERKPKKAYHFEGKKVLLVEDQPVNMEIAAIILREQGIDVDIAEDGSIAVEKLRNAETGDYDCVLMDIQMPIMDGYQATREIRGMNRPGISDIPIFAMTANAFEEDRIAAMEAGMDGHIAKPIDINNLFDTLATVLG